MPIKCVRIDDRFVHGQVATYWLRHVNADQIICISDAAAANPVQGQVMKMAAPDLAVHVFGVDKFIKIYNSQPIRKSTFLILGSTSDVLALVKGGVNEIKEVNFGGMRPNASRTHEYTPLICFSDEEEKAFYELLDLGIKIDYKVAAFDEPVPLLDVLKSNKKS
ncbi:PTS sugar transporter subunit IIB [uncultured Traorella sp.]|uniref:PTS system mannose/fructose/N-acetylgalactosamine-transporter subunit IIB n=1 Tax=uncultured Traorella sp. TaxID=1929048 RepID=UPI0025FF4D1D|nr:PTS sugar transporter subunit IIB [uncultured Traorella sp.]